MSPTTFPAVRRATPADAPAIERLVARAYDRYLARNIRPAPLDEDYAQIIADHEVWVLNAADGTSIAVLVLVHEPTRLLLDNVAVDPGYEGRGFGRRMLEHAEYVARKHQHQQIALYTNRAMVENQSIYEHIGYSRVACRRDSGYDRIYYSKAISAES